jgi:tetratricopeptide (TPR) repeat protein
MSKLRDEIEYPNVSKLRDEIEYELSQKGYSQNQQYAHGEVLEAIRDYTEETIPGPSLLYLVKKDLIRPSEARRGESSVYAYSFQDVCDAILIFKLRQMLGTDYSVAKVKRILAQNKTGESSGSLVIDGVNGDLGRLLALAMSRFMHAIADILCAGDLLHDGLIALRKLDADHDLQENRGLVMSVIGTHEMSEIPEWLNASQEQVIVGRSNERGEILLRMNETSMLKDLDSLELVDFYLPSVLNTVGQDYEVILGLRNTDRRVKSFVAQVRAGSSFPLSESEPLYAFLSDILRVLFEVLKRNDDLYSKKRRDETPEYLRGSMLSIITNLVTLAPASGNWDYCSVLLPTGTKLRPETVSQGAPFNLKEVVTFEQDSSLVGMVYSYGIEEILRDLIEDDPRFSEEFLEQDELQSIALLPLRLDKPNNSFIGSRGVLLIAIRRSELNSATQFDLRDLMLARFLAGIIAEVIGREDLIDSAVHHWIPKVEAGYQAAQIENEMLHALENNIADLMGENQHDSDGLLFFVVRVDAEPRKISRHLTPKRLLTNTARVRTYQWIRQFILQNSQTNWQFSEIYIIDSTDNGIVISLYPVHQDGNDKKMREDLREWLDNLKRTGERFDIRADVWSLSFKKKQLERRKDLVEFVSQEIKRTIANLPFIRRGELQMTEREFDQAEAVYRQAEILNGKSPYILRHRAQALLGKRKYAAAEKIAAEAAELENGNAAALRLLGDALAGMGKTNEARQAYDKAIEAYPINPKVHLHLATFLVEQAYREYISQDYSVDLERFDEIRQQFTEAIRCIGEDRTELIADYYATSAEAFERLRKYDEALEAIEYALLSSPENVLYESILQRLQQQAKDISIESRLNVD